MSNFTYNPPPSDVFLRTMRAALDAEGFPQLADLLRGSECEFYTNGNYSRRRWDAYAARFRLRVGLAKLKSFSEPIQEKLLQLATRLLPSDVGYDLMSIEVNPFLADDSTAPSDEMAGAVTRPDYQHVRDVWTKAIERREDDPAGAVTAARTLLESVIKHVLDDIGEPYDDREELPKLYSLLARKLDLAPASVSEPALRQQLQGCASVVQGVGAFRSKAGDAHGYGKSGVAADTRHAELAVNLAGAMATFIIRTMEAQDTKRR